VITNWVRGLIARQYGRLLAAVIGIAVAVALLASLGVFLAASKSTMTARAASSVSVDWQVQVASQSDPAAVLSVVSGASGVRLARTVTFAQTTGLSAVTAGSTQTTGPGVVVGIPASYAQAFPGEIRPLTGATGGVLIAQQTAANLHVAPGDTVTIGRAGLSPVKVVISGVVDLPQADSLFQKVGAPAASQPAAPPDNVVLVPPAVFTSLFSSLAAHRPDLVTTQIHVARSHRLPPDPAESYVSVVGAAHNLEAALSGAGVVGNNLGAALDGARKDAAYAQILFLFLGFPGAVLAGVLTAAIASAGRARRRREQALMRARGATMRHVSLLATSEAALLGLLGGIVGLVIARIVGRWAFGTSSFGASHGDALAWTAAALLVGFTVATMSIVVPAVADFRQMTVASARMSVRRESSPRWMRSGVDLLLLAVSGLVFWQTSRGDYTLVLAPEGVATISVNYWAFLGPALLWIGAGLFSWRLALTFLRYGRSPLTWLVRPLTGRLAATAAAGMSRQRGTLARSVVLVGLALSFAVSTAVFNQTYRHQAEVDARLTNGADIAVTESPGVVVGPQAAAAIASVPGVRAVEPLLHRFAYVGADLQDLFGVRPGTVAKATSLQNAYFQGGTAVQLMATLAAHPDAILVSDETVKDFQLRPGDLLNLRLQDSRTKKFTTVPFHYAGVAKEFPTAPHDSFFVANADYVVKATGSSAVGTFLVDTGGTNIAAVSSRIRETLGTSASVTNILTTRKAVGSSLTSVDLSGLTRVELGFALVLAVGAGGLVLALGLAERRRSFAIVSVLGAGRRQMVGLVLSEAALVTVLGLVGGALGGWLLSQMLVKVLTGVFDPPPEGLSTPAGYLLSTLGITVAAIFAAALLAARAANRSAVEQLRQL
jgi:putative ABC transport system permease protein